MAKLEHVRGLMRTFLVGKKNQTPAALCVQVQERTHRLRVKRHRNGNDAAMLFDRWFSFSFSIGEDLNDAVRCMRQS